MLFAAVFVMGLFWGAMVGRDLSQPEVLKDRPCIVYKQEIWCKEKK